MNINSFSEFKQDFPEWEKTFRVDERDDSIYKRIQCTWRETGKINETFFERYHHYYATINVNTGDIFLDCRKRKIFCKHLTLLVLRPMHTLIKTLWHATIVAPLIKEVVLVVLKKQDLKGLTKNTFHSLCDIVRTPPYGLAITITHLTAIIFACISPNSLYKTRTFAGNLERAMLRAETTQTESLWWLSSCFSPMRNIAQKFNKTISTDLNRNLIDEMLKNFAFNQISFRRNVRGLFNDCLRLLPNDKAYISPAKLMTRSNVSSNAVSSAAA